MKEPKKVKKALNSLKMIVDILEYYMGPETNAFKDLVKADISPLIDLLKELSVDQKKQNAKLAKRLKKAWKK